MGLELEAALSNQPWSVSGLLFDAMATFDAEGRPLGERRAPSEAKRGVPLELVPCPYQDERQGTSMNLSALKQMKRFFGEVMDEIGAFHTLLGPGPRTWEEVLAVVVDQLAGPALYLLAGREASARVPTRIAVGHKLAAGYFGVMRRLITAQALGQGRPVTVPDLLEFIHQTRALIGEREVCGGPPKLIARASEVLLGGLPGALPCADRARLKVATGLATQLCLGIAWEQFDQAAEVAFFQEFPQAQLRPVTGFLERRVADRRGELEHQSATEAFEAALRAIPAGFAAEARQGLALAFAQFPSRGAVSGDLLQVLSRLEPSRDSGFELLGAETHLRLAQ